MSGPLQILGLARRAGRLALGHEAVERALREGRARLVIVATDASEGSRQRFVRLAARQGVPVRIWGHMAELGHAVGHAPKAVLAVCDARLAARLLEAWEGGGPAPSP